ncbi:ribonuclease Z [Actinomadura atramentaria]|uniref:ribonuclease Z n=1 Tax=Actinomadura atramentaria TaxID=1990 RepID=UPI001F0A0767|nr:ribonuclease Z [Actinomadura atramentaria]
MRDLRVLGSASAVPTKRRNHNGYLLRWDGYGLLFDPGEGTQRQMALAGASATELNFLCVTHFHGDHCLGVPGIVQRIARDGVPHPVVAAFPESGAEYWARLRHASLFRDTDVIVEHPLAGERAAVDTGDAPFTLTARRLSHPVEAYGYRLAEPDGRRMLPAELARRGIAGPLVRTLLEHGTVVAPDGRTVAVEEVSEVRPGQVFALVMDTRLCDGVGELAADADMLVIESTFLDRDAALAADYGHLTAGQAGRVAADGRVRHLVLTHFSERYGADEEERFRAEAAAAFSGEITVVHDLDRVPVPKRRDK